MPRTDITITDLSRSGVAQPAVQNGDNVNGMQLPYNDGHIFLELSSTSGTTIFSFVVPGTVDGQAVTAKAVSVATGTPKLAGPFPPSIYNFSTGKVNVDIDTANGRIRAYHF